MNIGFEAKRIFENRTGLGNYSRNIINLLDRFYPNNKYKLFAPRVTKLYKIPYSSEVITPKNSFYCYLKSFWRLYKVTKLLNMNAIDIFHGLSHMLPYGIEKTGIPSVVTIHDLIFLRYPEYYKKMDRHLYHHIYLSSCQRATRIIAISNQTKSDLINYFKIDPKKIAVIYQSCDSRFYNRLSEERKTFIQLKYKLPQKFILCVGTVEQRKNQLALLKAIVMEKLDVTIVILGKPTEYINILNQFISESGIQKQVIFLHNVTTDELQGIYQMAEVMVYPSIFEGFGLPIIEAQASQCAVITSNISSLPEAGGEGALYINPTNISELGKAIHNVLSIPKLKEELIKKGSSNAEKFNEKLTAERLMNLYKDLKRQI